MVSFAEKTDVFVFLFDCVVVGRNGLDLWPLAKVNGVWCIAQLAIRFT